MSLPVNDWIKGQEKTSSCPAAKSILMLWRSHFFGSLCSHQKTVSAGQECRKPARWKQLFSSLTLRGMLTLSIWRKPLNWTENNTDIPTFCHSWSFFTFFLTELEFPRLHSPPPHKCANPSESIQLCCGKWIFLASGGAYVQCLPSVTLLSRGMYDRPLRWLFSCSLLDQCLLHLPPMHLTDFPTYLLQAPTSGNS